MSPNKSILDELTGQGSAATRYQLRRKLLGACANCGQARGEDGTTYYCRPCADKKAGLARGRRLKMKGEQMKLWHISQNVNNGYDTYSDAVVAAETEQEARMTHPSEYADSPWNGKADANYDSWCNAGQVVVVCIGQAYGDVKKGVICASFHAA